MARNLRHKGTNAYEHMVGIKGKDGNYLRDSDGKTIKKDKDTKPQ